LDHKKTGLFILLLGTLALLYILFLDLLQGQALGVGKWQLAVAVPCALGMLTGALMALGRMPALERAFTRLEDILECITSRLPRLKPRTIDILVLVGFVLFSLLYTLGRWKGLQPFIFLGSDASYISSYAAALDHPGQFAADYIFSSQAKIDIYFAAHVPLIRELAHLTGDYGTAFLLLLPLALFLKLFYFYALGKRLFHHRGYALLLAVLTTPVIYTGAWDYWGLLDDALPRNLFEIAFPWLLYWLTLSLEKPRYWYLCALALSALIYVHSISSLPMFLVFALVFLLLARLPLKTRLRHLVLGGLLYLAAAAPFFINSIISSRAVVSVPLSPQEHLDLLLRYYGSHLDIPAITLNLAKQLTLSGILPLAALALGWLLLQHSPHPERRNLRILAVMLPAVLVIALLVPWLESFFDVHLNILAELMQLVRFVRWLPPLLILFSLLVFSRPAANSPALPHLAGLTALLLCALTFAGMVTFNQQGGHAAAGVKCLASGRLLCPTDQDKAALDIMAATEKLTKREDTLLAVEPLKVEFLLSLRYQALRPLGLNVQDLSRMRDDLGRLAQLRPVIAPWSAVAHSEPGQKLAAYLQLAPQVGADYLILQLGDFPKKSLEGLDAIYRNDYYALVKIQK